MRRFLKTICLVVAAVVATTAINAQDLQSQRGESQDLGEILGHKGDHGGLIINPYPQKLFMLRSLPVDITKGVKLVGEAKSYAEELGFVKHAKKGVKLTIKFDELANEISGAGSE